MPKTKAQLKLLDQIQRLENQNTVSKGKISEKDHKLFTDFVASLKNIVLQTDKLYTPDENGNYPKMSTQEHSSLLGSYKAAINQSGICQEKISKSNATLSQLYVLSTIAPLIADDFNALNALDYNNPGSLPEAIQNARTLTVDVTGQSLSTSGANMSSRIPIAVKGDGEAELQGYFTKEVILDQKQDLENALKKSYDKYPKEVADHVQKIFRTSNLVNSIGTLPKLNTAKTNGKNNGNYNTLWRSALKEAGINEQTTDNLLKDSSFSDAVFEYSEEYLKIKNKYAILNEAGIDPSQNIEKRNSAMSTVADLLGRSKLIARSKPMKIIQDGVAYNGTFMENAEGVDLAVATHDNPIFECNVRSVNTSTAFKDVADLQVLDYICGNVDRHGHNFFYKVDNSNPKKPLLSGITGIDNDCSFGTIVDPKMKLIDPKEMRVISESMAKSVKSIDENVLKTALLNYNFTKEELSAAYTRLNTLKKTIELGEKAVTNNNALYTLQNKSDKNVLFTIKDEDFGKLNFKDVVMPDDSLNLFTIYYSNVQRLPATKSKRQDEFVKSLTDPQKNPAPTKRTPAKASITNIVKNQAFKANDQKLNLLLKNLDKTDPWYVRSSDEFKSMRNSLKALCEVNAALPPNPTSEQIKALENCYNDVQQKSDAYLEIKDNSRDSKRARLRAGVAKDINLFAKENIDVFYDAAQEQQAAEKQNKAISVQKEAEVTASKKAYLEFIEKQKNNSALFNVGQEAVAAHAQLCEYAITKTLAPPDQQIAGKKLALMVAYEKLAVSNQLWNGKSAELDKILSKDNALNNFAETIMQDKSFKTLTENITPQFLQDIVNKGVNGFNEKLDKMNIASKPPEKAEVEIKKEQPLQKKEKTAVSGIVV